MKELKTKEIFCEGNWLTIYECHKPKDRVTNIYKVVGFQDKHAGTISYNAHWGKYTFTPEEKIKWTLEMMELVTDTIRVLEWEREKKRMETNERYKKAKEIINKKQMGSLECGHRNYSLYEDGKKMIAECNDFECKHEEEINVKSGKIKVIKE